MKANEAPEKLYFGNGDKGLLDIYSDKESDNDVEYTRTDAFIKKACEYWYQYNRDIVKNHGAKAVLGCSEFTVHVEDFRKYLEESKV